MPDLHAKYLDLASIDHTDQVVKMSSSHGNVNLHLRLATRAFWQPVMEAVVSTAYLWVLHRETYDSDFLSDSAFRDSAGSSLRHFSNEGNLPCNSWLPLFRMFQGACQHVANDLSQ